MIPPAVFVNGIRANPRFIALPIKITHGRSQPESQPDAPSATLVWGRNSQPPRIGDILRIDGYLPAPLVNYDDPVAQYDDPGVTYDGLQVSDPITRFHGVITDVTVAEYAGLPAGATVTAVGMQSHLGTVGVLLDRPIESDVSRVQAIATAAGVPITILGNPGPNLAAHLIDTDALSALHQICNSSGGLVWSGTDGTMHYGTGDHREDVPPVAAIDSYAIISGLDWKATITDLINKITVTHGPANGQTEKTLQNDASIAVYGERWTKAQTQLAEQADADYLGALVLARRSWAFSRISDVMIDSGHVQDDEYTIRNVMQFKVSDAVFLPIPPDPSPAGLMAEWMIEGWTEEWPAPDRVAFQIAVTDRARFAQTVLREWQDADDNSWQTELDNGAWLNALIQMGARD